MGARRLFAYLLMPIYISIILFFFFFFPLPALSSSQTLHPRQNCTIQSSRCGTLNVTSPFHLKGASGHDLLNCSNGTSFELICQANTSLMLSFGSDQYLVKHISYPNQTLRLVDQELAEVDCPTSGRLLSPTRIKESGFWPLPMNPSSVAFLKCSDPIDDPSYNLLTCSRDQNKKKFYFHFGLNSFNQSKPTCQPYAVVPLMSGLSPEGLTLSSTVREFLQMGFQISWVSPSSKSSQTSDAAPHEIRFPSHHKGYEFTFGVGKAIGDTLFIRVLLGVLHLLAVVIYVVYRKCGRLNGKKKFQHNHEALGPSRYSYSDIKRMTENFREKLGQGGFGSVYKGRLQSGQRIAVKMLDAAKGNGEEFINEVVTIGRIHHVNVVRLIGFCSEGSRSALVYEFMPNGSLDKYIFSNDGMGNKITREKLHEIALGVARGIEYLHRGCNMRILHFDIKPHNILLDGNFSPKVSDFGLAKLFPTDHSIVSISAARGTAGYMAPELFSMHFGGISYKSDVYSFGMLLLEIAGRRKNFSPCVDHSSQVYFPTWVYDQLVLKEVMTENGNATKGEANISKKLAVVGLWCIQINPDKRPSMSEVVEMLEGNEEVLEMPPKPFLASPERHCIEDLSLTDKDSISLLQRLDVE